MTPTFVSRTRLLVLVSVLLSVTAVSVQAQGLVLPLKRRAAVLQAGERYIHRADSALKQKIGTLKYPFAFEVPPEPVAQQNTEVEVVAPEPEEIVYTDEQVLTAFISKFKTTGVISRGERDYLVVEAGNRTVTVPEGSLIRFNYEGKAYGVRITDITDSAYTLGLGEAAQVCPLNKDFDADQLRRYQPQP